MNCQLRKRIFVGGEVIMRQRTFVKPTTEFDALTRRDFVKMSTAAVALLTSRKSVATTPAPIRTFEHGSPLKQFRYDQITFQTGLHDAQLKQTHSSLMEMSEDGALRPYRLRAGLPAPGEDLQGTYYPTIVPGHSLGQWISGLARYFAVTGDEPTRLKVNRLVEAYARIDDPTGKFYEGHWASPYVYDKIVCGLIDAYQFTGNKEALRVLSQATDRALPHLPGKAIDPGKLSQIDGLEGFPQNADSYELPENQFIAWQLGGDERHLEMAKAYLYHTFFDPLSRGENVLAGRHAYSHVNSLCSAAKAYLVLGDEKYLKAAVNGFTFIEQQSFATGGCGPAEQLVPFSSDQFLEGSVHVNSIGDSLNLATPPLIQHQSFETCCGAYAHFKLTRYLLRITKDSRYGDSMERMMYNTILGALPLQKDGRSFYYADFGPGGRKRYVSDYPDVVSRNKKTGGLEEGGFSGWKWPCCSGTLPQIAADYRISSYLYDASGIYVNLYVPSTVTWDQRGVQISLTQSGHYPLDDSIAVAIIASRPVHSAIRLRIPAWAEEPSIRINGKKIPEPVHSGTFATISREWRTGDRVELELPRRLELKPVDDQHPDTVSLVCGPVVLFSISDDTPEATRSQLLTARQLDRGSAEWRIDTVQQGGLGGTIGRPLSLVPFWSIKDERYFTYLSV
jgi:uncharacterized protein